MNCKGQRAGHLSSRALDSEAICGRCWLDFTLRWAALKVQTWVSSVIWLDSPTHEVSAAA